MLTEQQLTEDIEIDDEPVDRDTAHSLFFDTYYKSLKDIESSERQLLENQEQLRWYTSQLDEVDRLADEARIPNSSTLSSTALPLVVELDLIRDEENFKSFFRDINELKDTKVRQSKEISNIRYSNQIHIQKLNSQLTSVVNKIKELQVAAQRQEHHNKICVKFYFFQAATIVAIITSLTFLFASWLLIPGLCAGLYFVLNWWCNWYIF